MGRLARGHRGFGVDRGGHLDAELAAVDPGPGAPQEPSDSEGQRVVKGLPWWFGFLMARGRGSMGNPSW